MTARWLDDASVAVVRDAPRYPASAPFDPSEAFPEWPGARTGAEDNPAYRAVRSALATLGLDAAHAGTAGWNPLGDVVRPGDVVVLKPNFVSHRNMGSRYGLTDTDSLVTHGSVIRAVADYVARALDGRGTIIIGDCPVQGTDWDALLSLTGMPGVAEHLRTRFPGIQVLLRDYRLATATLSGDRLVSRQVDESRRGEYVEVDLGADSALVPLMTDGFAFGVSQYPRHRMRRAHTRAFNAYLFPREVLDADVVINLAKLKSHMKAGVTLTMKNLVGINGHKDYLPHFRFGSPRHGGDEYPDGNWLTDLLWGLMHREWDLDAGWRKAAFYYAARACSLLLRLLYRYEPGYMALGGGSWHGNDTAWRMVHDINRAFLYYDRAQGRLGDAPGRQRYFSIVDGIVGGHRESPLAPSPYASGVVLAGWNPVAVDVTAAAVMGFDWKRLRQLEQAWVPHRWPLTAFSPEAVKVLGIEGVRTVRDILTGGTHLRFEPSRGFRGAIEWERVVPSAPGEADEGMLDPMARLPEA